MSNIIKVRKSATGTGRCDHANRRESHSDTAHKMKGGSTVREGNRKNPDLPKPDFSSMRTVMGFYFKAMQIVNFLL